MVYYIVAAVGLVVGEKPMGFVYADIVMSVEDIFGYTSSKTAGRIWTKLGRGMGNGERVILQFFWRDRSRSSREGVECQPFT